jgi:histidyl-tRNA synthetase
MRYSAPRGTKDVFPPESGTLQRIEEAFRRTCSLYGYGEVRTPTFEAAELFLRTTGETTDIVTKEMYLFRDRGGREMALRPEVTPGVVRAWLQVGGGGGGVARLFYIGSIFRYERPQAGRYREAHQVGVEALGSDSPLLDVEVIDLCGKFLGALGLQDLSLEVNSMGCPKCRPLYREAMVQALGAQRDQLCELCQRRLEQNPLRILDCKTPECKQLSARVPPITEYLCEECGSRFQQVQEGLSALGYRFAVQPRMVRGLDYYTRTVFEISSTRLGAQAQVCGGGRYDDLVEELGGPPTPAAGFACGLERIALLLGDAGGEQRTQPVFVAYTGESLQAAAFAFAARLREAGVAAEMDYDASSLRAQMRSANRAGAAWAALFGEDEQAAGAVTLRDMSSGEQEMLPLEEAVRRLAERVTTQASKTGGEQ